MVGLFVDLFGVFFVGLGFFTQMRSSPIFVSVRLPQDLQASDVFSVISLYSRILTWTTAVFIRHFFHPLPASQAVLEPGAVTAW